jgi:hypothetical protein
MEKPLRCLLGLMDTMKRPTNLRPKRGSTPLKIWYAHGKQNHRDKPPT